MALVGTESHDGFQDLITLLLGIAPDLSGLLDVIGGLQEVNHCFIGDGTTILVELEYLHGLWEGVVHLLCQIVEGITV